MPQIWYDHTYPTLALPVVCLTNEYPLVFVLGNTIWRHVFTGAALFDDLLRIPHGLRRSTDVIHQAEPSLFTVRIVSMV